MPIESINHYIKDNSKRLGAVLYMTALSSLLASCTLPPTLTEVSYDVTARVGLVTDVANPDHPSDELLFPNLPEFKTGQLSKEVDVPWTGYFEVNCKATQVIGPQKLPLESTMSSDEGDTTYLHAKSENGGFLLDRNRAQKVNARQYYDKIKVITIKVGDSIVKRNVDPNGPDNSTGLLGGPEQVEAYKFKPGKNQVSCKFSTLEGITYTDTAIVNIIDNRS